MTKKLCKDCKHCEVVTLSGHDFSKCNRPVGLSVVDGSPKRHRWHYCSTQRMGGFFDWIVFRVCGEKGRYFEKR